MNLISCQYCGVVIDTDRIEEPEIYDEDTDEYYVIEGNSVWVNNELVSAIDCPCCDEKIAFLGKG